MLKKQLIERPFQMISLIIPFICLSFPAATFHLPTGDQTFLSFHLRLTELTPFDLQLHRLFQAGPCLPIKSRIIITSLITKLINNPSSHFRRQVWWLHRGESESNRQSTRPAAGIHRSELQILRSFKPQSALSCIFSICHFYRTQVYLGSDLWVRVSLTD